MKAVCAFCLVNVTTASLDPETPICWRPCYAALNKIKGGMEASAAMTSAFSEVPDGFALAASMTAANVDAAGMLSRLVERASGANLRHLTKQIAIGNHRDVFAR